MPTLALPTVVRCRRCGERIFWAWSPSGKRLPLDAQPQRDGVHELEWADGRWYALRLRDTRAMLRRNMGQELHRFHECEG